MPVQPPEATDEQSATSSFPFDRLPPEIQLLVLEAALPSQRIFHVSGERRHGGGGSFTFHVRHAPPAVLSVCRAARTTVLRRGLFLDGAHGAFFLPAVDMLYLDRSHRRHLQRPAADDAWAAVVQHVGVEWRALPRLVPLPEEARVPWGDSLVMHELPPPRSTRGATLSLAELLADARKSYLVPWGQMRRMIEDARRGEEAAGGKQHGGDWRELDLRGFWLLRADAVYAEDVTSFWS
ncbi:hypothetical protein ISF_07353 [Cordyceps fumosorosea ARSEF 2679]|uniref:2EXR domain-containing protein n=1 Tax=Cordyceps fumosorosea (strain ARSEF 2679) TaxID=1081104 RepID=A0A167PMY7_CORFA|nr:hypothetical protein ISF_07353 [Cordyceps fumosorosea ARSEF 2679]OAA56837.1 hypothetical protein ISF_07353 [Cordyceps fumosorosea ARSEF 2679]